MTISSTVRIAGPFTGNGVTTTFPFTYKVFSAADVQVIRLTISTSVETTLTIVTDYTITLNGDQDSNPGGNIVLVAALSALYKLTATSNIANLQPTDLTNQGGFYPEVITDALDRATIQIQQISDIGDRTLKIPISDGALNMELPTKSARINKILAFDGTGIPTVLAQGGNTTITGTLNVTGVTTLSSTLGVTGQITGNVTGNLTGNAATATTAVTVTNPNLTGEVTTSGLTATVTNSAVIGKVLTGYTSGAGTVAATDTILQAIQKLNGNTSGGVAAAGALTGATLAANVVTSSLTSIQGLTVGKGNNSIATNSAYGVTALNVNTTGSGNTAIGSLTLKTNTDGYSNTAIGKNALEFNISGYSNTALGEAALRNNDGNANTAVGFAALLTSATASSNVAVGFGALQVSTLNNNTAVGTFAGGNLTGGSNVTCIGYNAQPSGPSVSNEITLGNGSVSSFRCQVLLTVVSDERDKTNIVEIPVGLNLISKIRPVSFEWNQRDGNRIGRKEFGFTAQQLQTAQTEIGIEVPHLVGDENPEQLGVSASQLIPVLVKAIQELNAKFEAYVATHP